MRTRPLRGPSFGRTADRGINRGFGRRWSAGFGARFGVALGMLWCASALAHHGTSEYEMNEEISLTGTVAEWTFQNPHSWLRLDVAGPDGAVTEWSIESAPPNYMARQGWSAQSLARGEEVTVLISPLRDRNEPNRGILLEILAADGDELIVRPPGRFGRPALSD
jgi:hypothetical protein